MAALCSRTHPRLAHPQRRGGHHILATTCRQRMGYVARGVCGLSACCVRRWIVACRLGGGDNGSCRVVCGSGFQIVFAEAPDMPGVPVVYRLAEARNLNPEQLNLDRRKITICPLLEGEGRLRLLNYQNNQIQHMCNLHKCVCSGRECRLPDCVGAYTCD